MAIDVNTKINNYLCDLEDCYIYDEMNIMGHNNIEEYMKRFSNIGNTLMYTPTPMQRLNIKAFEKFDILRIISNDSEIIMITKDGEIVFKTISIKGTPFYKVTCDDIVLKEERKNVFTTTDVYYNDDHILSNHVIRKDDNTVEAEKYVYTFGPDSDLKDKNITVVYEKGIPRQISFKYFKFPLVTKFISDMIGIDLDTQSGRDRFIESVNCNFDELLGELHKQLFEQKNYMKRR